MYAFDPSAIELVVGAAALAAAALGLAVAVSGTGEPREGSAAELERAGTDAGDLSGVQKAILWSIAVGTTVFLLWWATLPTSSGGRPPL